MDVPVFTDGLGRWPPWSGSSPWCLHEKGEACKVSFRQGIQRKLQDFAGLASWDNISEGIFKKFSTKPFQAGSLVGGRFSPF